MYSNHGSHSAWSTTSSANDERREKANYAWAHPSRHSNPTAGASQSAASRPDPFASRRTAERAEDHFDTFAARELRTRLRNAANARPSATASFGEKAEEEARLINDSGFKRTGTVVGLFAVAMGLAGVFSSGRHQKEDKSK